MGVKSIIIIGAGLAGLSTGVYAQINGYESRIFEHHSKAGGLATAWKRGEYLIDGGIHFLIAHKPGTPICDVYKEIGTNDPESVVDMTTYLRFVNETGDTIVNFTKNLDKLERDLIEISPDDAEEIQKFIKEVRWMKDSPLLTDLGMSVKPPELRGRFDSLSEMWQMRGFMKYFMGKYSRSAQHFAQSFKSRFMKTMFENLFSPDGPIWFVIMILATVAAGQLGLLKEGCPGFIQPIVKKYESLGGEIQYNSTVIKIIVENNKAKGVILEDGSEHRADVIVSAADGRNTIFRLLEGKYLDDRTRKIYDTWKKFDPTVMVSLGVSRSFEDDAPLNMFMLQEPFRLGSRTFFCLPLRVFNYGRNFAPAGKTVIQAMFETDWNYWYELRKNREAYEAEKQQIAEMLIRQLEILYPGITSEIEMVDVATPYTTWRYTLNDMGSPMGWLMTKDTLMTQLPRTLPNLDNFYMAGQWVLPGGGVPGCIYSGRNVIQILCKRDRKQFRTEN
ncbi:MAG: phytoene desaturase family protein [Candidatus Odinarchaeota archaeon]